MVRSDQPWYRHCSRDKSPVKEKTYFSEMDLLLVDHAGGGGVAPAVHQPPPVPHQEDVGLLLGLRQAAGQRVADLVLQRASVRVNLDTHTHTQRGGGG